MEMVWRGTPLFQSSCLVQDGTYVSFDLFSADAWNVLKDPETWGVKKPRVHSLLLWVMHQEKDGSLQATCANSGTAIISETIRTPWQRLKTKSWDSSVVLGCDCFICVENISSPFLSIFSSSFLLSLWSKQAFLCTTCFLFFYFMMIICIH